MIDYEEDWIALLLTKVDGSLVPRSAWFAIPSCCLTLIIKYWQDYEGQGLVPITLEELGLHDITGSQLWNGITATLMMLLGFRTKQGLMRFWQGTGLLHQMRGEWFDTVSNCVTFSISAKKVKPDEVTRFRHTLVRLMSRCHGSALEEIAENSFQLEAIDTFGLDYDTLHHLKICHEEHGFNKVEVMLHLVQSLITRAFDDGILKVPPPVLSRVYQTISRGFVRLLNAKKITDTRFPFPYVQLMTFLLLSHCFLTPCVMSVLIRSKIMAVLMTFIPIIGMFSLNFIAAELENPFGTDDNDLPMEHFQEEMNLCLLMLLHHNTDMITGVSDNCITNFSELLEKIEKQRETGNWDRLSTFDALDISHRSEGTIEPEESERGPEPAAPPPEPAPPAPEVTPEVLIAKGIDELEANLKCWMQSVQVQVGQLNESMLALKKFNETTSEMILSTDWPTAPSTPRTEGTGWQIAISPV